VREATLTLGFTCRLGFLPYLWFSTPRLGLWLRLGLSLWLRLNSLLFFSFHCDFPFILITGSTDKRVFLNLDVRTVYEFLRMVPRRISRSIVPLEHTVLACHSFRQLIRHLVDGVAAACAGRQVPFRVVAVGEGEEVLVEAGLIRLTRFTKLKLEKAFMMCGNRHSNIDFLTRPISRRNEFIVILTLIRMILPRPYPVPTHSKPVFLHPARSTCIQPHQIIIYWLVEWCFGRLGTEFGQPVP